MGSEDDARYLLDRHRAWLDYFENTPSCPTAFEDGTIRAVAEMGVDMERISARKTAMELPLAQFKVYETIANKAKLRLSAGDFMMHFGEVCIIYQIPQDEQVSGLPTFYKEFPVRLLAHTCIQLDGLGCQGSLAAVIRWATSRDMSETYTYYLCLWDPSGEPCGMFQVGGAEFKDAIDNIESLTPVEGKLRVRFVVDTRAKQQDFPIDTLRMALQNNKVAYYESRDSASVVDLRKENSEFVESISDLLCEVGYDPKAVYESRHCSVVFSGKDFVSFRIETEEYTGGAHANGTVAVGTIGIGNGRKLVLSDIVTDKQIEKLTELIRNELMKQLKASSYQELRGELLEDAVPTNNFYYDDKGLHFVYNEYEIGSHGLGVLDVCVPWPFPKQ